jgi:uncharacterized protein YacL
MNCYLSAGLGLGLLGGSLYTMMVPKDEVETLRKMVNEEAAVAYQKIAEERMKLYIQGLIIGLSLAMVFKYKFADGITNSFHRNALFILITLMTTKMYYMLMPKSDYMLNYVQNNEQSKEWLRIYNLMKSRYHTGFLVGAIATIPLSMSLC